MPETQTSLAHYLSVIRRQWWLILLVALLAPTVAAVVSALQETTYRAAMKVVVGQSGGVFQPQFGSAVDPFSTTMRNLLSSDVVAAQVIERQGLDLTSEELLKDLHVSAKPQSSVLEVSYDSPDKQQAVATLAEVGRVFTALVDEKLGGATVTTDAGEVRTPITATVFDPAHLEPDPVSPRWVRNIGFAAVLGLVLGLVLAFARDSVDNRLRNRHEAEEWFAAPVIGTLPKGVRGSPPSGLLSARRRGAARDMDALHLLRANLEFAAAGNASTILVTSAVPEEGKSTLVANLGVALALSGKNVVCVEADMRQPKLNTYLDAAGASVGLADVLEGGVALQAAMRDVPLDVPRLGPVRAVVGEPGSAAPEKTTGRLSVVASGTPPPDPATLLTPDSVSELVAALSEEADYVIVDVPPLLAVADAFPFVLTSDMVIVVARQGKTTRQNAEAVRRTLHGLGARVSVVITDADRSEGYGYGYGRRS
ncbi:MAG TPA: Wzz/FepE/Etk N-terminal domain-containing protein [Gaiellaceae bacterium]|nr:Wzz/FepE/Etk N-terminal domain-containing protein [Gaiellaceae bacterium]